MTSSLWQTARHLIGQSPPPAGMKRGIITRTSYYTHGLGPRPGGAGAPRYRMAGMGPHSGQRRLIAGARRGGRRAAAARRRAAGVAAGALRPRCSGARRPGQLRRDRGRQEGRPGHGPRPRRLRGARGRPGARTITLFARGDVTSESGPRRAPPGAAVRHQRQHGGEHRLLPQRRHQVPEHAAGGRGHHPGGLRHRGPGRALRPERLRAARRADPPAQAGRQARRSTTRWASTWTARRSRRAGGCWCSTPTAATPAAPCRYSEMQTLLRASDITLYAIGFLAHLSAVAADGPADEAPDARRD